MLNLFFGNEMKIENELYGTLIEMKEIRPKERIKHFISRCLHLAICCRLKNNGFILYICFIAN